MNNQLKALDYVIALAIILLTYFGLYYYIQELSGNAWFEISWGQLAWHMCMPMLFATLFLASVLLVRAIKNPFPKWIPMICALLLGAMIMHSVSALASQIAYTAMNPTIEYNEGGVDNSAISLIGLDLPKSPFGRVSILVVERHDLTAEEAAAIVNGTPKEILVPKGAKGQVFFQIDNRRPSQATSFGN